MKKGTVVKVNGEDVGVRENYHGEIFIDKIIYLNHPRIINTVNKLKNIFKK